MSWPLVAGPRASSKKTRIETGSSSRSWPSRPGVRGQVPRKQGLKLGINRPGRGKRRSPRASSKKTRIETNFSASVRHSREICPRASSKKTRIETDVVSSSWATKPEVRGQVPRKQGLKPHMIGLIMFPMMSEGKFQENKD